MKNVIVLFIAVASSLLFGCANNTRSISQTQYSANRYDIAPPVHEIDEYAVLGLDRDPIVSEDDIQRVIAQAKPLALKPGSTVLLVQSGAIYPDGAMVAGLSKTFHIVPFTGVATNRTLQTSDAAAYSRTLRLAAARAGASTVICYWGILESGSEKFATKTISWLPVVNWVLPDERQHMRIRLKIAMVDVATGSWSMFSAEPLESKAWSVKPRREVADQKQIERIKKQAYELAAQDLVKTYATPL